MPSSSLSETLRLSLADYLELSQAQATAAHDQLQAFLTNVEPLAEQLLARQAAGDVSGAVGLGYLRDAVFVEAGRILEAFTEQQKQAMTAIVLGVVRAAISLA